MNFGKIDKSSLPLSVSAAAFGVDFSYEVWYAENSLQKRETKRKDPL